MNIITKENIYKEFKQANSTVYQYWQQLEKDNYFSSEQLQSAKDLTDKIFRIRKNKNIDQIFIDMFKVGEEKNTCNLANYWGADIGGLEEKGLKVVFINYENGVNIQFNNPKTEDADKYLKIIELFNLGLENLEQYKKVLTYYKLDENLEPDNNKKNKQNKI